MNNHVVPWFWGGRQAAVRVMAGCEIIYGVPVQSAAELACSAARLGSAAEMAAGAGVACPATGMAAVGQ